MNPRDAGENWRRPGMTGGSSSVRRGVGAVVFPCVARGVSGLTAAFNLPVGARWWAGERGVTACLSATRVGSCISGTQTSMFRLRWRGVGKPTAAGTRPGAVEQ
jgi:hypothetical protein